jgi:hypothetical protein
VISVTITAIAIDRYRSAIQGGKDEHIICAGAIALMASTGHAQGNEPASRIEGSFLNVVAFHGPSGFALIETLPPLIDYQGQSFQSLTFAITPPGDQT